MAEVMLEGLVESDYVRISREFGEAAAEFFCDDFEEKSGYQKMPTGAILLWGETTRGSDVKFPIALSCIHSVNAVAFDNTPVTVSNITITGFSANVDKIKYMAIGN